MLRSCDAAALKAQRRDCSAIKLSKERLSEILHIKVRTTYANDSKNKITLLVVKIRIGGNISHLVGQPQEHHLDPYLDLVDRRHEGYFLRCSELLADWLLGS
jgi:hypothetical protein